MLVGTLVHSICIHLLFQLMDVNPLSIPKFKMNTQINKLKFNKLNSNKSGFLNADCILPTARGGGGKGRQRMCFPYFSRAVCL